MWIPTRPELVEWFLYEFLGMLLVQNLETNHYKNQLSAGYLFSKGEVCQHLQAYLCSFR